MTKILPFLALGAFMLGSSARAATFTEACPEISACVKAVSELLEQKYIYDADVKGKIQATPNLELTKENAEWLFTNMLYINGFSRVPQGAPRTFMIQRIRDAKDSAIPVYEASERHAPQLPGNWDYATLRYKAAHPEVVGHITRMTRNFMPPNSRIIANELSGTILVTDAIPNLRKMYDLVKELDRKPSPELRKKWEREAHERRSAAKPDGK